jgi:hypothetical protein
MGSEMERDSPHLPSSAVDADGCSGMAGSLLRHGGPGAAQLRVSLRVCTANWWPDAGHTAVFQGH